MQKTVAGGTERLNVELMLRRVRGVVVVMGLSATAGAGERIDAGEEAGSHCAIHGAFGAVVLGVHQTGVSIRMRGGFRSPAVRQAVPAHAPLAPDTPLGGELERMALSLALGAFTSHV